MPNKNIHYNTKEILEFYSARRRRWDEFYPSERWVFEEIVRQKRTLGDILDVGCACGGLGAALDEKAILDSYTGIDIHKGAIEWANREQKLNVPSSFIAGDILELDLDKRYDTVISLSCADWNIETDKIINTCWERVRPGGYFIISLRLTPGEGINDITRSYQRIEFSGRGKKAEIANYVVFNFGEIVGMIKGLEPSPDVIGAYGYWGRPSPTTVTPFNQVVFTVFYIRKGKRDNSGREIKTEFNLPPDIFS